MNFNLEIKGFKNYKYQLWERATSTLRENFFGSVYSIPLPLPYLKRRFHPNTPHTQSECWKCFEAWEALEFDHIFNQ